MAKPSKICGIRSWLSELVNGNAVFLGVYGRSRQKSTIGRGDKTRWTSGKDISPEVCRKMDCLFLDSLT
jgi:hypothetical protein